MFRVSVDIIVWYFYWPQSMLRNVALGLKWFLHGESHPSPLPWSKHSHSPTAAKKQFHGLPCRYCQKSCWGQGWWQFSLLHLRIVAVPPNPHVFLSHVFTDMCSGHLLQRLDELKGTLRGDNFQCLQDHFDWNRVERNPTIHRKVSKHSHPRVNVWTHAQWQICPHSAKENGVFSALDQKQSK